MEVAQQDRAAGIGAAVKWKIRESVIGAKKKVDSELPGVRRALISFRMMGVQEIAEEIRRGC